MNFSSPASYDCYNPGAVSLTANFHPFIGANHCIINIFCAHCKHCGLNWRFRLSSDKEKEALRFYLFHKNCQSVEK